MRSTRPECVAPSLRRSASAWPRRPTAPGTACNCSPPRREIPVRLDGRIKLFHEGETTVLTSTLRKVARSPGAANTSHRRARPQVEAQEERVVLSFAPASNVHLDGHLESVVAADFSGDGRADLAVANFTHNTLNILL